MEKIEKFIKENGIILCNKEELEELEKYEDEQEKINE